MTMHIRFLLRLSALFASLCIAPLLWGEEEASKPFSVVGYLPNYRIDGLKTEQLEGMTELIYFSIEPTAEGGLPETPILQGHLDQLKAFRLGTDCGILISVGGWGRSEHFPAMAGDVVSRGRFIQLLKSYCLENGFSGVDYDWEHPKNQREIEDFASLIAETRCAFKSDVLKVTVAQASWQDLGVKVYQNVHQVHLMAYDHGFPQATFSKSTADVERLIGFGCPVEKIVMGIPFYGRNQARDARTYQDLISAGDFQPSSNLIEGYAFNGPEMVAKKVQYASEKNLGGVMIWEIGQDSQDAKTSLMDALRQAKSDMVEENTAHDQGGSE